MTSASAPTSVASRPSPLVLAAFVGLAAIAAARPLISETFERVELSFLNEAADLGPTPATTVFLDLMTLSLAVALLTLSRAWLRLRGVVVIALGLLAAAVAISTAFAADRRDALNAGANLIISGVCALALSRGAPAPWMPRLLLAALIASGATNAFKCVTQYTHEFEATYQYWRETQRPALREQGVDLESPAIVNYERRLRSGDAFGYLSHPNVTGSLMAALIAPALALSVPVLLRLRREPNVAATGAVIGLGVGGLLAVGVWLTGSRGAVVAGGVGVVALLVGVGLPLQRIAKPRGMFLLLIAVYVAGIVGGGAYGLSRGGLPGASLNFRWEYWTAAWGAWREAPWTGLGRLNFVNAYLRHKLPAPAEEVRDPHNLWVSLLVELGPIGLAAGALLMCAGLYGAIRNLPRSQTQDAVTEAPLDAQPPMGVTFALGVTMLAIQAVCTQTPLISSAMFEVWMADVGLVWAIVLGFTLWLMRLQGASAFWTQAGLVAALMALLLHALVEFALLTPAGAMMLAALIGCAAWRAPRSDNPPRFLNGAVGAFGVIAVIAYLSFCAAPTMRSERALSNMQHLAATSLPKQRFANVSKAAADLLAADKWDGVAALSAGELLATIVAIDASTAPEEALRRLDNIAPILKVARERTGNNVASLRASAHLAELKESIYRALGDATDANTALSVAVEYYEAAVLAYPSDPRGRIAAGNAQFRSWNATRSANSANAARVHYQAALHIDAMRAPEMAAKLNSRERERVQDLLAELATTDSSAPTTTPG